LAGQTRASGRGRAASSTCAAYPASSGPAICSIMPCMPAPIALLDIGANSECRPEHLRQFAVHGAGLRHRGDEDIPRPTVGFASASARSPRRGRPTVVEAHQLIACRRARAASTATSRGATFMNLVAFTSSSPTASPATSSLKKNQSDRLGRALHGAAQHDRQSPPRRRVGGLLPGAAICCALRGALDPEEYVRRVPRRHERAVIIAHGSSKRPASQRRPPGPPGWSSAAPGYPSPGSLGRTPTQCRLSQTHSEVCR